MNKILIVGTIFVDCKATAGDRYDPCGRNLGTVKFIHGGVARNVAENLSSLNFDVVFASTAEDTLIGNEVLTHLKEQKINIDYVKVVDKAGMGIWSVIMDKNGNQLGAISQMPDISILEENIRGNINKMFKGVEAVLLEFDLSEAVTELIIAEAEKRGLPVYALPGNMEVVLERQDLLAKTECFVCNDIEAGRLFNMNTTILTDEELLDKVKYYCNFKKINSMVVTQGEKGCIYYNRKNSEMGSLPSVKTKVVDASGAGDAFFSGLVAALLQNATMKKAAETGTTLASLTIRIEANTFAGIEVGI